jgi:hypothetical protein
MNQTCVRCGAIVLAVGLVAGAMIFSNRVQPAFGDVAQATAGTSGPHFTVVETEGNNLVVTDNSTNTLYFYTVDKGQAPGSEMKLRAKVDLNQVGKPSLMPVDVNIQK